MSPRKSPPSKAQPPTHRPAPGSAPTPPPPPAPMLNQNGEIEALYPINLEAARQTRQASEAAEERITVKQLAQARKLQWLSLILMLTGGAGMVAALAVIFISYVS